MVVLSVNGTPNLRAIDGRLMLTIDESRIAMKAAVEDSAAGLARR